MHIRIYQKLKSNKRNQENVSKSIDAVCNFLNQFAAATNITKLHSISTGVSVSTDVDSKLLNAEKLGKEYRKTFVENKTSLSPFKG